ncbi:hypothetical protein ACGFZQ_38235 [Streptomyces sp. NPDC048254]|uniref:hypothetical protein n=1 Tax=Streptomyces sp. NPDC048254 TaxID=3365525 RepID=UPI00371BAB85
MTPSLLETRYRTVLRILPAYYRREREEEMVETYLCDIDRDTQDQSRPALWIGVPVPAEFLRGGLVQTAALALLTAALAIVGGRDLAVRR